MNNTPCYLCNSNNTRLVQGHTEPDKYMRSACIIKGWEWYYCSGCGLYFQPNPLSFQELEEIYSHYRDKDMRGVTIEEEFDRIMAIIPQDSENYYRYRWFGNHYEGRGRMLDIGSGLGVWPYQIKTGLGFDIQCVEPNVDCAAFINDSLNIPCLSGYFYPENYDDLFDVVSVVHVLEHMADPEDLLVKARSVLRLHGKLFIEVPDSVQFSQLPPEHDEFNSAHLFFFNVQTLATLVENAGFNVTDIHRVYHEGRDLSRILMLCNLS